MAANDFEKDATGMLVIKTAELKPGLNHIDLPLGAEVLDFTGVRLSWLQSEYPAMLESWTFLLVVGPGMPIDEAPPGKRWQYVPSSNFWVFELVDEHTVQRQHDPMFEGESR